MKREKKKERKAEVFSLSFPSLCNMIVKQK